MPQLGPHISIPDEDLLTRVFRLTPEEFKDWPETVRSLASGLASELFLVHYNPFIDPAAVRESVERRLNVANPSLSGEYPQILFARVQAFWNSFDQDEAFKGRVLERLRGLLPEEAVGDAPNCLVECATDATDLRIELPMAVIFPESTRHVRDVVRLAGEMGFGIVPRGGGTGLTGGAIPARRRTIVLSLSRLKKILDVDPKTMTIRAQAGVITQTAIKAAQEMGLLFTVDPASKTASSLGGNVSENSGGPFAFEYGTTIDNISSYLMVSPVGEVVTVRRVNHPDTRYFPRRP